MPKKMWYIDEGKELMSRSYKKAIDKCAGDKSFKHVFNRSLRRQEELPNGKAYRKFNCTYDIYDCKFDNRFEDKQPGKKHFKLGKEWKAWK